MIHVLIFSFFTLGFTYSNAQVWGNQGAKWHYKTEGLFPIIFTGTYESDTVLGGFQAQTLRMTQQPIYPGPGGTTPGPISTYYNFTRISGDSVFHWVDSTYFLLYDFGADIGDTWVIGVSDGSDPYCDSLSTVLVVDTGSMVINGLTLRTLDLSGSTGSSTALSGKVVERIGTIEEGFFSFLFPSTQLCDPNIITEYYYMDFLCYEDDNFTTYKEISGDCDYILYVGLSESHSQFGFSPNPVENNLNVNGILGDESYVVFNSSGKVVREGSFLSGNQVDLHELESGHYFIRIENMKSVSETLHFIKK